MEDEPITEFQSFSPYYFKIALFIQLLNPVFLNAFFLCFAKSKKKLHP